MFSLAATQPGRSETLSLEHLLLCQNQEPVPGCSGVAPEAMMDSWPQGCAYALFDKALVLVYTRHRLGTHTDKVRT